MAIFSDRLAPNDVADDIPIQIYNNVLLINDIVASHIRFVTNDIEYKERIINQINGTHCSFYQMMGLLTELDILLLYAGC